MRKLAIMLGICVLFVLLIPVAGRKRGVPLLSNGKVVAIVKRPLVVPWRENEFCVCNGNSTLFSLGGDFFEFPLFIYPFADKKRFLCIYDYDTSILVFVVESGQSAAIQGQEPEWPTDENLRRFLAAGATNVVMQTNVLVRLPRNAELQEASSHLASLTPAQFRAASLPSLDLGAYRFYFPKEALLGALQTNRLSYWP